MACGEWGGCCEWDGVETELVESDGKGGVGILDLGAVEDMAVGTRALGNVKGRFYMVG